MSGDRIRANGKRARAAATSTGARPRTCPLSAGLFEYARWRPLAPAEGGFPAYEFSGVRLVRRLGGFKRGEELERAVLSLGEPEGRLSLYREADGGAVELAYRVRAGARVERSESDGEEGTFSDADEDEGGAGADNGAADGADPGYGDAVPEREARAGPYRTCALSAGLFEFKLWRLAENGPGCFPEVHFVDCRTLVPLAGVRREIPAGSAYGQVTANLVRGCGWFELSAHENGAAGERFAVTTVVA